MTELALTNVEVNRLESLEEMISRGAKAFFEVGIALTEIRESRLYRAQYDTFEQYCLERWNFTAARGRQLMGAVEAIASLPDEMPKPSNSAQASALAGVPEDRRTDVWSEAVRMASDENRAPTARDIREIAESLEDSAEVDEWSDGISIGEANINVVKPIVKQLIAVLKEATDLADGLSKTSAKEWMLTGGSSLLKHIRDARDHVNASKPAGICPECSGNGCRKCFDTGWLNATRMSMLKK